MEERSRVAKLLELLQDELQLEERRPEPEQLKEALTLDPTRPVACSFLLQGDHQLRAAAHHDLSPDALILDPGIATLGLIVDLVEDPSEVEENPGERAAEPAQQATEWISKATYLRHLLLGDSQLAVKEGKECRRLPWFVEVVFLLPDIRSQGAPEQHMELNRALFRLIRQTEFFQAVGVNLLKVDPLAGDPFREDSQKMRARRSFAWLLRDTRTWFERNPPKSRRRLKRVTLDNYRLAGRRCLTLDEQSVHLLHGWNGSGKSSIAEALELVVTGRVQRLRRPYTPNKGYYRKVIQHRSRGHNSNPAKVSLEFHDHNPRKTVIGRGLRSLHTKRAVTSFRLDQPFMDKLSVQPAQERARIFLQSFVPEEKALLDELEELRADVEAAREDFSKIGEHFLSFSPESEASKRKPERLVQEFQWLDPKSKKPPNLSIVIGCPIQDLERLVPFRGELESTVARLQRLGKRPLTQKGQAQARRQLRVIEEAARELEATEIEKVLDTVQETVERLHSWEPRRGVVGGTYSEVLNQWLRLYALCDLAQKLDDVYKTFTHPRLTLWQPQNDLERLLQLESLDRVAWNESRDKRTELREERDRLLNQLLNWDKQPSEKEGEDSREPMRLINEEEARALNTVGGWLGLEGLGSNIKEAMRHGATPELGEDLIMGAPGWSEKLEEGIQNLRAGLDPLRTLKRNESLLERMENLQNGYQELKASFDRVRELGKKQKHQEDKLEGRFVRSLSENEYLRNALNELMTLFTPARWAYEPLKLNYEETEGTRNLRLLSRDNVDATLRLNTAELNVFTVALFLLCSVKVENPLSLLILDDPLQNMDELTVTTVARGLARIMMTQNSGFRLLMMFHGEDDLERFAREIPAQIHRIPWLSASPHVEEDVRTESGLSWERQDLSEFLELRPISD